MTEMTFESIINGEKVKLKLIPENIQIERLCDTEYHLAYTELMAKGIMPRATLEKRMQEKGIWAKEDEQRLAELQTQLAKLHIELEVATTHEKGLGVASQMGALRSECLKLVEVKAAVLANSCESLADQIRRDAYLAYGTAYADTNKPVFKDYHDFLLRATEQVVVDARTKMLNIATQAFNESLTGLPEVNYVRKVEGEIKREAKQAKETQSEVKVSEEKVSKKKKVVKK